MGKLWESFVNFFKGLLIDGIVDNITNVFQEFDQNVDICAGFTSATPQSFNGVVFNFISDITDTVIAPLAGIVISFVLIYELISAVMDRNSFHDIDAWFLFKFLGKACIGVFVVSHTAEIVNAIFELGAFISENVINRITDSTNVNHVYHINAMLYQTELEEMGFAALFGNLVETFIIKWAVRLMSVLIAVIALGRFMEIYLYMSVAPVPFSTFANREWGSIGTNYLRGLLALSFQGFLMALCIGIYSSMIQALYGKTYENFSTMCFALLVYTVVLVFALLKTGSLSKQIFNAH
jgi:hypothetical protein